jgi:hypothetical protein
MSPLKNSEFIFAKKKEEKEKTSFTSTMEEICFNGRLFELKYL